MKKSIRVNVHRNSLIVLMMIALMSFFSSCTIVGTTRVKNAPPGQVKKATGSQSAKPYAPGQQKKKTKN